MAAFPFPPAETHVLVKHSSDSAHIEAVYGPFSKEFAEWLKAEFAECSIYGWTLAELRHFAPLMQSGGTP